MILGTGAWAQVRLAVNPKGEFAAAKIISKKDKPAADQEVEVMRKLDHPNAVKLLDTYEDAENIYLFLEYCKGGDLFELIAKSGGLDEPNGCVLFSEILDAVIHLHMEGFAHLDLKLENIFLTEDRKPKIGDFGESALKTGEPFKEICGSPTYCPPELLQRKPYDGERSDVWALGCVLYAIMCGELPYCTDSNTPADVLQQITKTSLYLPEKLSPDARDLLKRMLEKDPDQRIRLLDIAQHVWIQSFSTLFSGGSESDSDGSHLTSFDSVNNLPGLAAGAADEEDEVLMFEDPTAALAQARAASKPRTAAVQ
jgi:serine/threonine protein kinase